MDHRSLFRHTVKVNRGPFLKKMWITIFRVHRPPGAKPLQRFPQVDKEVIIIYSSCCRNSIWKCRQFGSIRGFRLVNDVIDGEGEEFCGESFRFFATIGAFIFASSVFFWRSDIVKTRHIFTTEREGQSVWSTSTWTGSSCDSNFFPRSRRTKIGSAGTPEGQSLAVKSQNRSKSRWNEQRPSEMRRKRRCGPQLGQSSGMGPTVLGQG